MKTLYLIRHAKSSWQYPHLADHDRPLNSRGNRDRVVIAQHLKSTSSIDVIYSSSAVRAVSLAQTISQTMEAPLVKSEALYTFEYPGLLKQIRALPEQYSKVAVVGHNPALHNLVNSMSDVDLLKFPTSAIAEIECDIKEWKELAFEGAKLVGFIYPKMFRT